jgi:radical SAM protein with 4Fe4S-binding SPASM domain
MTDKKSWGTPFTDEEIATSIKNNGLLTMELELSRICNLRCVYCYAESGNALPNELTYDEIIDAMHQGADLGARKIIVLGGGEPMAYPRIMDILREINGRGLEIELFTNATLLTPEIIEQFLELGVNPVIKSNSRDPEIQDMLAGKKGTHAEIQKGMQMLLDAGYPTKELSLGAQTIVCNQNYEELPDMWRWLRDQSIIPYFEMITEQGRAKENMNLVVTTERLQDLFTRLSEIDRKEYGIEWEPKPPVAAFTCQRHLYSCTVSTIGDVVPCPGVDISTGNIREQSLKEILATNEVFQNLRNIRQTIKGKCKSCDLTSQCYGCRGMAHHFTGDYLESDPLCWHCEG